MRLIKQLTDKNGHQLVNVPADPVILMQMGFSQAEAQALCAAPREEVISQKIADIKAHRDAVSADHITLDGHHFHSDANSRIQQMTLTRMGQAKKVPAGLMWQTKNHGLVELTNAMAAQFESVTLAQDMHLFAVAQKHIAAIEALEDVQAMAEYDYSTGWQV